MCFKNNKSLSLLFVFFATVFLGNLQAFDPNPPFRLLDLKECLLPKNHPLQKDLQKLFTEKKMFRSPNALRNAGFNVHLRVHREMMVSSHSSLKNYLFKKFQNSTPNDEQIENYVARVNGARALEAFIERNQLKRIEVPKKWIYPLPDMFLDPVTKEKTYILIVELMPIYSDSEVTERYYDMNLELLRELCFVVFHFRGLDSIIANMPITRNQTIAFIDTERWNYNRKDYLLYAMSYLSSDRQEYARSVFRELEMGN